MSTTKALHSSAPVAIDIPGTGQVQWTVVSSPAPRVFKHAVPCDLYGIKISLSHPQNTSSLFEHRAGCRCHAAQKASRAREADSTEISDEPRNPAVCILITRFLLLLIFSHIRPSKNQLMRRYLKCINLIYVTGSSASADSASSRLFSAVAFLAPPGFDWARDKVRRIARLAPMKCKKLLLFL
jgi:hypothetical protein